MARRPELLSSVVLRQNPHNVAEVRGGAGGRVRCVRVCECVHACARARVHSAARHATPCLRVCCVSPQQCPHLPLPSVRPCCPPLPEPTQRHLVLMPPPPPPNTHAPRLQWHKRVKLFESNPTRQILTYTEAVKVGGRVRRPLYGLGARACVRILAVW